jgi:hypothetical protein
LVLLLGGALVNGSTHACGGKVVVDTAGSPGTGGMGGAGGHGGGPSDACMDLGGPVNPVCKTEGAQCFFADTSCAYSWTCHSGMWSEGTGCLNSAGGGAL